MQATSDWDVWPEIEDRFMKLLIGSKKLFKLIR
jgi:hypothetical protein